MTQLFGNYASLSKKVYRMKAQWLNKRNYVINEKQIVQQWQNLVACIWTGNTLWKKNYHNIDVEGYSLCIDDKHSLNFKGIFLIF